MRFREYRMLLRSDLYRYEGETGIAFFLKQMVVNAGFTYTFWMRTSAYLRQHRVARFGLLQLAELILLHCTYKYGISIPYGTQIGSGFYVGHFGGIVVHGSAVIGKNCNISHGVTIGRTNRGPRQGTPVIGDNVYLGPGAKIIGNVRIGNSVAIGANCVVTKDIPDNAVVVGVPGRVISYEGSQGYVEWTDD